MRTSLTTKHGKAKCLAYRNSKRCGRVAKVEGRYSDRQGNHHQSLCKECTERLSAQVMQESNKGFTVHNTGRFSGMTAREYRIIK